MFKGNNSNDTKDWFMCIKKHIDTSDGYNQSLEAPKIKEFWREEQINEREFIEKADTFDVLLMQCATSGAAIVRTYTSCIYDHAAMVLKFEEHPNEIFFLEATSNNGVSLRRWSSIKPHLGTFYMRVVLRHIDWDRTDQSLDNLEVFMKEVVGNSYSFSMK